MATKNLWKLESDKKIHLVWNNEITLCGESITEGAEKPYTNQQKITCPKCARAVRVSIIYSLTQIK